MSTHKPKPDSTRESKIPRACLRPVEIARKLNISTRTVQRLLRGKTLPGVKIGRLWIVNETDLENFFQQLRERLMQDQKL